MTEDQYFNRRFLFIRWHKHDWKKTSGPTGTGWAGIVQCGCGEPDLLI